mgnify:CR=1 FL=1
MASTLVDLVKINVTNTGTGALSLGIAAEGYRGTEALINGKEYSYSIQQGQEFEYGRGVYLEDGAQLTRSVQGSSNGGEPIELKQNSQVAFVALSADLSAVNLTAQVQAAAEQVTADAAQVAEDRAFVGQIGVNLVNGQQVYPNAYSDAIPKGVTYLSADGQATGSGGTPGTYDGGVTGGPEGFTWQYVIGLDGKIQDYTILSAGLSAASTLPTLSYPSGSITGATLPTPVVSALIENAKLASQNTIYVASNGSDTKLGDISNPLATPEKAAALALAHGIKRPHIKCIKNGGTGQVLSPTGLTFFQAAPEVTISTEPGVYIDFGNHIGIGSSAWTLTSGTTEVYQKAFTRDDTDNPLYFLWIEGTGWGALPTVNKSPLFGVDDTRLPCTPCELLCDTDGATPLPNLTTAKAVFAAMTGSQCGFWYDASNIYVRAPGGVNPGTIDLVAPRKRWFGDGVTTGRAGKVRFPRLTLRYGGIYGNGQEMEMGDVTILMAYWDGHYPTANTNIGNLRCGGCGNDGDSPHAIAFAGSRGLEITVGRFLGHDNRDEARSGHYEGCIIHVGTAWVCYNGSAGIADALGCKSDYGTVYSSFNCLRQTGGVVGDSAKDGGVRALNNNAHPDDATEITIGTLVSYNDFYAAKSDPGVGSQCSITIGELVVIDPIYQAVSMSQPNDIIWKRPKWRDGNSAPGGFGAVTMIAESSEHGAPALVGGGFEATPTSSAAILRHVFADATDFADDFAGSVGKISTNPTSSFVATIKKNGSNVGSITVSTAGSFTFSTTGGALSFAVGDVMLITAPATVDATAAGCGFTLKGAKR